MSGGAVGAWIIQPLTGIGVGGRPVRRTHRGDAATSRPPQLAARPMGPPPLNLTAEPDIIMVGIF